MLSNMSSNKSLFLVNEYFIISTSLSKVFRLTLIVILIFLALSTLEC